MDFEALSTDVRGALAELLLAIADDDFLQGQQLTEWIATAPTMEEDNALSGISQDEFGHARLWYELLVEHEDALRNTSSAMELAPVSVDTLAMNRSPTQRRNTILVETRHDDFADTIAIHFLYDMAERRLLESLAGGDIAAIADRAEQALAEESYHGEHADRWLDRLVTTDEARARLGRAFEKTIPRAADYFAFDDVVAGVTEAGVLATPLAELESDWRTSVRSRLEELPVDLDDDTLDALDAPPATNGRVGEHTEDLDAITERLHPDNVVGDHPVNQYIRP